eukprot:910291_1
MDQHHLEKEHDDVFELAQKQLDFSSDTALKHQSEIKSQENQYEEVLRHQQDLLLKAHDSAESLREDAMTVMQRYEEEFRRWEGKISDLEKVLHDDEESHRGRMKGIDTEHANSLSEFMVGMQKKHDGEMEELCRQQERLQEQHRGEISRLEQKHRAMEFREMNAQREELDKEVAKAERKVQELESGHAAQIIAKESEMARELSVVHRQLDSELKGHKRAERESGQREGARRGWGKLSAYAHANTQKHAEAWRQTKHAAVFLVLSKRKSAIEEADGFARAEAERMQREVESCDAEVARHVATLRRDINASKETLSEVEREIVRCRGLRKIHAHIFRHASETQKNMQQLRTYVRSFVRAQATKRRERLAERRAELHEQRRTHEQEIEEEIGLLKDEHREEMERMREEAERSQKSFEADLEEQSLSFQGELQSFLAEKLSCDEEETRLKSELKQSELQLGGWEKLRLRWWQSQCNSRQVLREINIILLTRLKEDSEEVRRKIKEYAQKSEELKHFYEGRLHNLKSKHRDALRSTVKVDAENVRGLLAKHSDSLGVMLGEARAQSKAMFDDSNRTHREVENTSTALQEMLSKKESEIGQLKGTILRRQQKSQARSEQTRKELTDAWLRKRMGLEDMCLELQIHFCVQVKISSEVLFCSPPKLLKLNKLYLHCQVNVSATH